MRLQLGAIQSIYLRSATLAADLSLSKPLEPFLRRATEREDDIMHAVLGPGVKKVFGSIHTHRVVPITPGAATLIGNFRIPGSNPGVVADSAQRFDSAQQLSDSLEKILRYVTSHRLLQPVMLVHKLPQAIRSSARYTPVITRACSELS